MGPGIEREVGDGAVESGQVYASGNAEDQEQPPGDRHPPQGEAPEEARYGLCAIQQGARRALVRPRNARILGELINVAVRRAEVHPGITAYVLLSEQEDFNPVGLKLAGGRLDIVYEKACDRTGREMTIDIAVRSKDLNLASVRQLQQTESRKVEFRSKAQDLSKKVDGRFEVLRTST